MKEVRDTETQSVVGTTATVGRLLDEWMERYVKRHCARATVETYQLHVDQHIKPAGGRPARQSRRLPARPLPPGTRGERPSRSAVKLDHSILSGALTHAEDWDWKKANPAKRARVPEAVREHAPALTVDQPRELCLAAEKEDPDMAMVIALAAHPLG